MMGIDITRISRFDNKIKKEMFIKRLLHPLEIEQFKTENNPAKFLATRWAIKEALYKSDNNLFHFAKILLSVENCRYKFKNYLISTSIEDDYCIAWVIKEQNES